MKKPFTLKIDEARLEWLKAHAAGLRRTITSVIEESLDDYKARHKPTKPGK